MRFAHRLLLLGLVTALTSAFPAAHAATHTLDDPASPIRVVFDTVGARLTVTIKADGFTWTQPVSGGGSGLIVSAVSQPDASRLTATATTSGAELTLGFELRPAVGELAVTIDGATATVGGGLVYPWPFYTADDTGFAVVPVDGGYVVPVTETAFSPPSGQRGMEWMGGTDAANERGWVALVDTPDDYELKVRAATLASGAVRLGTAPSWRGSNAVAVGQGTRLAYQRRIRYRFPTAGGYVALAKLFRASADERGWLKTFAQKQAQHPGLDLTKLLGAPVIYLWGDGRSSALLDALRAAGIEKALVQVSVNHTDHRGAFPADALRDGAWFDAVRNVGYLGGVYDIYAAVRPGATGGAPYDGFTYLWPTETSPNWIYRLSDGQLDSRNSVSATLAAAFARDIRLPAHRTRLGFDACFVDVVCAVDLREDYDTTYGHFATRANDRQGRSALLDAAYSTQLITGTEQGRSWAVPQLHWVEGKAWIGTNNVGFSDGAFNDQAYPEIMTDVINPTNNGGANRLPAYLSDGFQAPLWELVFHDCVVSTVHWHRAHNKYLYGWDHADRFAMLRGQAPLMQLTHAGTAGVTSRVPNSLADSSGRVWSTRWAHCGDRVLQTYRTVCAWHATVGALEMTDHRRLTADRSVQLSEFSGDGGVSGHGIIVHFGSYDGATGINGTSWTGTVRGVARTVAPGETLTYTWDNRPASPVLTRDDAGAWRLSFAGAPGETYEVQRSTDLASWSVIATDSGTTSARVVSLPSSESGEPKVFYRVAWPAVLVASPATGAP